MNIQETAAAAAVLGAAITHQQTLLLEVVHEFEASMGRFGEVTESLEELATMYGMIGDETKAQMALSLGEDGDVIAAMLESAEVSVEESRNQIDAIMQKIEEFQTGIQGLDSGM